MAPPHGCSYKGNDEGMWHVQALADRRVLPVRTEESDAKVYILKKRKKSADSMFNTSQRHDSDSLYFFKTKVSLTKLVLITSN